MKSRKKRSSNGLAPKEENEGLSSEKERESNREREEERLKAHLESLLFGLLSLSDPLAVVVPSEESIRAEVELADDDEG